MLRLESSTEKAFVRACKRRGVWQIKLGFRALPDRIALLATGRIVFIEFKRLGEEPRKNQAARIRKLKKFNFQVEVIDTNEEAIAFAEGLSEENRKASHQERGRGTARRDGARENAGRINGRRTTAHDPLP